MPPEALRVAVIGATGRMGRRVADLVWRDPGTQLSAAIASPESAYSGKDIGIVAGFGECGVAVSHELSEDADVVIDFSAPEASLAAGAECRRRGIPIVVATTGFTPDQRVELESLAQSIPLLVAANCSLVVNVLMKLTQTAGTLLKGRDFDVEIVERHHRYKADAPSGTALVFAKVLQETMGLDAQRHGREGLTGTRPANEIGLHAVRAGDNVGEHTIIFSTLGETMELVHKGHSRDSYAKGAVAAAKFLARQPQGRYSMADVLGL